MSNHNAQHLWRQIEQAGGIDAYVRQQLTARGYLVERKPTDELSDKELKLYKQALKKEAAHKRKIKQEAWLAYKQNHIIHIGEYYYWNDFDVVDKWDLREPEVRAADNDLPILDNAKQLAEWLDIPVSKLRWLCYHRDAATRIHYHHFQIPKRNGSPRDIWAPLPLLKSCQRKILHEVVEKLPVHGAAHGFMPGRSTFSNAQQHSNAALVIKLDIKDFFPSVTFTRIKGIFRKAGFREQVAILLAALCSESPRKQIEHEGRSLFIALGPRCLPQGAPTSPALTNTLCLSLDTRISAFAEKLGLRYTRYADDLTFSSEQNMDAQQIRRLLGTISAIVLNEGFSVNKAKTRVYRHGNRQQITGLVVNGEQPPRIPRRLKRQVRAAIHNYKNGKPLREGETLQTIKGYIAYIQMCDAQLAEKLRQQLEA